MFTYASFFDVVAMSVDRFLAIHLHLRYQESETHKLVAAVVTPIRVLSVRFPYLVLWVSRDVLLPIEVSVGSFCLLLSTVAFIRSHKNQIQDSVMIYRL